MQSPISWRTGKYTWLKFSLIEQAPAVNMILLVWVVRSLGYCGSPTDIFPSQELSVDFGHKILAVDTTLSGQYLDGSFDTQ